MSPAVAVRSMISRIHSYWCGLERYDWHGFPSDFEERHTRIIKIVAPYTLTGGRLLHSLIESTRYVLKNKIEGAFVECGVYKGGSMMAVALTLIAEGVTDRDLYLFDTFEGMPAPDDMDIDAWGRPAMRTFLKRKISAASSSWANASLRSVKEAMASTGYPAERIHYVKGLVEHTLPASAMEKIALLRLDTDWYKSTMHELVHLYPRLSSKGILIVDDYGHFQGARQAVDEYFDRAEFTPYLHRINYSGRLVIK